MFSFKICVLLVAFMGVIGIEGKIMNRCQIAKELKKQGFPEKELNDWVCLVESESTGNTAAVGGPDPDGSHSYGLFQINDRYWCDHGKKGKECNIDCQSFLNDDITDDVKCVKKIYKVHGFDAWVGWQKKCKGGKAHSVASCFK